MFNPICVDNMKTIVVTTPTAEGLAGKIIFALSIYGSW
jgi:hypothetical protein